METIDISKTQEIFTVSRLNREVRFLLEGFSLLWIEGEIVNFTCPTSGHWYFFLKDKSAQVRCAMFRQFNRKLNFTAKDGMHVLMKVRVSLYEGRGDFQLLAEHMEEVGEGKLRQAYEALKKRLQEAGLFDAKRKKPLPSIPKSIGIISSPTGAAIRDILNILRRRFPYASVMVYPTLVQGNTAASNIVNAIQTANLRNECDVLIIARGGGSLEDLWSFNEEIVAHAIAMSKIPIISGVGHEIDFTIADFVADHRAPTPSAAAELITPDTKDLLQSLQLLEQRFARYFHQKISHIQQTLVWIHKHLQQQHPKRRIMEQQQQLDRCQLTLIQLQTKLIQDYCVQLNTLHTKLQSTTPMHRINTMRQHLNLYLENIRNKMTFHLQNQHELCSNLAAKLNTLSPLATLKRGYALATKEQQVIQHANQVSKGDIIHIKFAESTLTATVDKILES